MTEVERLRMENKALRKGLLETVKQLTDAQIYIASQNITFLRRYESDARPGVEDVD